MSTDADDDIKLDVKVAVIMIINTKDPEFWNTSEGVADALNNRITNIETYKTINFGTDKGPIKVEEIDREEGWKEEVHEMVITMEDE